jgi:SnoaL-like domain
VHDACRRVLVAGAFALLMTVAAHAAPYEGTADDYAQISRLMNKYSDALDNRDARGWARVFTEDGTFRDFHLCLIGRRQIAGFIEQLKSRPQSPEATSRPKSHHINSHPWIEYLDRNHATAHTFVMVVGDVGRNHTGGGIEVTGIYDDQLRREGNEWLIADRREISPGDGPPPCQGVAKESQHVEQ